MLQTMIERPAQMIEINSQPTHKSVSGTAKAKIKRKQRPMQAKFPATMNFGVTATMAAAVARQCPPSSPFTQSDVGRLALHAWLLANDESYRREIAADGA